MTLSVWWAWDYEIRHLGSFPTKSTYAGHNNPVPVIRLADLREVVEGLERISNPDQSGLQATTDFISMVNELVRLLNQGRDEADRLRAQLKGVGDSTS